MLISPKILINANFCLEYNSQIDLKTQNMTIKPYKIPTEYEEQGSFVEWLKWHSIPFYHCPNGGSRNKIESARLKKIGVQAGIPDICIPRASRGYHGLYLEIKRRYQSKISPSQNYWLDLLSQEGYLAKIAYGVDQAIEIVKDYLNEH